MLTVKDAITGEVLGTVVANHSLSFDDIMELIGADNISHDTNGLDDGWYIGDVLYEVDDVIIE